MLDLSADFIEKRVEPVCKALNGLGVGISLVMVIVVTAHVLCRDLLSRPLVGAVELEELMLVVLVFLGMAYTQSNKQHISVDFLASRLTEKGQNILCAATSLLSGMLFLVIAWQSIVLSETYIEKGVSTLFLQIPLFPFMWIIALSFLLLGLVLFKDFLRATSRAVREEMGPWVVIIMIMVGIFLLTALPFWLNLFVPRIGLRVAQVLGLSALLIFLFSGMLIGAGLAFLGAWGMALLFGPNAGLGLLKTVPLSTTASYSLCVIPFFILMGEICFHSGLSEKLYLVAYKWVGHFRGGLSMATVLACGAFAAVSGSSLATAATMGAVALPEMKRYKYADSLATGSIAAGGTIGILIPPSVVFIIYGILVEVSIADLFFAGVIPGLISLLYYVIAIHFWTRVNPGVGPPGLRTRFDERVSSLKDTWEVLALFLLIMGGIYGGFFTPTEAGAIGASGAFVIGLIRKRLSRQSLFSSLLATGRTTSMVFLVVIGTAVYGYFLTSTQLPMQMANFVVGLDVPPYIVLSAILMVCFALGCVMGTLPLIFITVPIFTPVVETLGYNLIWFGVIMVVVSEIGLITPPVGMNVFIIKGIAKDVPLSTIFKGIFPFLGADLARLTTIIVFPQVALYLPNLLRQ